MRSSASTLKLHPLLVAVLLLAPGATAMHWSLHAVGLDESIARVLEDDEEVIHRPGNPLDGYANRVVANGDVLGGGGLFLDARLGNGVNGAITGSVGPHLYPGAFAADVLSRPDLLLPGGIVLSAWFGWWNDHDRDGSIRDLRDDACGVDLCLDDEFAWKGISSGDNVIMAGYIVPHPTTAVIGGSGFFVASMKDHTATTDPGWYGAGSVSPDSPFLYTLHSLVVADTQLAVGSALGYDLDMPGALMDVDRYEAVNPDVALLYEVTAREAWRTYTATHAETITPLLATFWDAYGDVVGEAGPAVSLVWDAVAIAQGATRDPARSDRSINPAHGREPTHEDDDYGGRAVWGRVGDVVGTGNSYPGYVNGYHFWADTLAFPAAGKHVSDLAARIQYDPLGARAGGRGAGTFLYFETYLFLWHDLNGDGHVGEVCDPGDPDRWDGEAGACRNPPYPWPHNRNTPEVVNVCAATKGLGLTFELTPLGGPWPSVVIVRDFDGLSGIPAVEMRDDSAPIELRWREACTYNMLKSRDALLFPTGGSPVGIRVESAFTLVGYKDSTLDVDIGSESVTDVDVLVATL